MEEIDRAKLQSIAAETVDLGSVIKSPLDFREYRAIQLKNGLKVILISTAHVDRFSGIKSNDTCHLKKVIRFNKSHLGLDDKFIKVRCECQTEIPRMADKSTITPTDFESDPTTVDKAHESNHSFSDALRAIHDLLYTNKEVTPATTTSKLTSSSGDSEDDDGDDSDQDCAAYLTVGAGYFNDPDDMPGMAHFCEHATFLGSKKFPAPNQLFRLIDPYDGYANAYTDGEKTVFEIATCMDIYGVALEMMGDMIGYPTLKHDLVIKEVEAVDAEFSLRQEDMPKYFQLLGSLAKDGHPLRKMDVGNRDTLRVPNFHKKLVEWRDSHYCANYITLALEAPMSLDELQTLAIRHFSEIPSCPLEPPAKRVEWNGCPFEPEVFHKIYHIPSIYHSEFMAIHWALEPAAWKNFSVRPLDYISSLINHKGEGGLYYFLNHFGWASNVIGGCWMSDLCCNQYASLFSIYIDMTEEGFHKQDYIIEAVFGYIEMLGRGVNEGFFKECQKQEADHFHQRAVNPFSSYAESASIWLQNFPAENVLAAPNLVTLYDPDVILKYTKLLQFERCNVMIFSHKYMKKEKMNSMEQFYQTPYSSYEFPEGLVEKVKRLEPYIAELFHHPPPNELLREVTCCGNQQTNIIRGGPLMVVKGKCSLYFRDRKFKNSRGPFPQAKYVFWFQSPVAVDGRATFTKMNLFANFLNKMIESRFVAALAAHHRMEVSVKHSRLQISLTGPSHQLPQLTKDLFKVLTVFEKLIDSTTFSVGRNQYVEDLDNVVLDNSWLAWDIVSYLFASHHQLSSEHKMEVEKMSIVEFLSFIKAFKKKSYIVGYLYGYVTTEQAFAVVQTVGGFMKKYPQILSSKEIPVHRCPKFPHGESIVRIRSKNPKLHTSVVINCYQFGNLTRMHDDIVSFLAKTMSDSAYFQLRTDEQLGYVVVIYHDLSYTVTSLLIELATQPKNYSTAYCNSRIDNFVNEFYEKHLSTEEKFKEFMKGKPDVDFSYGTIKEMYKNYLFPASVKYRKVSVQIIGSLSDEAVAENQFPQEFAETLDPYENSKNAAVEKGKSKSKPVNMKDAYQQHLRRTLSLIETGPKDSKNQTQQQSNPANRMSNRKLKIPSRTLPYHSTNKRSQKNIKRSSSNTSKSRIIQNLQEFRGSLTLYPNTRNIYIDD